MGAVNKRGVWVPSTGDGLLAGWNTAASQLGVYMPVASTSAASTALTQAEAAGIGATTSNPILFLVGSGVKKVAYVADGTKTDGKWNLAPLNEVSAVEQTYTLGTLLTVASGQWSTMISGALEAAPYDRAVQAWGTAYGNVTGNVDLDVRIQNRDDVLSRFSSGDAQSQSVTNFGIVPANIDPAVKMGVRGGSGGGQVKLSTDGRLNRLIIMAFPISMVA